METKTCESCQHFCQHYVRIDRRYLTAGCGHCVFPRLKHRPPETPACGHYQRRSAVKIKRRVQ